MDYTKVIEIEQSASYSYIRMMSFYYRGQSYFMKKKYDAAIADFETLVKIGPAAQKEELQETIAEIKKFKADEPKYNKRNEYYNLALEQHKSGKFVESIVSASKCLDLDSSYHHCYLLRGLSYAATDKHDAAINDFTECLRLKPNDLPNYYERAESFVKKKNYDAALKDLEIIYSRTFDKQIKERIEAVKLLKSKEN